MEPTYRQNFEFYMPLSTCSIVNETKSKSLSSEKKSFVSPIQSWRLNITVLGYVGVELKLDLREASGVYGKVRIYDASENAAVVKENNFYTYDYRPLVAWKFSLKDIIREEVTPETNYRNKTFKISWELNIRERRCIDAQADTLNENFVKDLKNIWQKIEKDDVVDILIGTGQFKAHKSILAARSPVFAAMLQNDTKEKFTNTIIIEDIDERTFEMLLKFIYANNLESRDWSVNNTCELLPVAEKYMLKELKEKCEQFLIDNVELHNCGNLLKFADIYSAKKLKNAALEVVKSKLNMQNMPQGTMNKLLTCSAYCQMFADLALELDTQGFRF